MSNNDSLVFSNPAMSSILVWKAMGERWYMAIVSKATRDRVGELVTTKGMDFAIDVAKRYDYHSGLYIEHVVPVTRIGRSVREMRIGKHWIEVGKFDKTNLADMAYNALQKAKDGAIRLSVGFLTPVSQRKQGVYTKLLKFDTSLVLKPAHPDTYIIVGGNNEMSTLMERVMKLLGPEGEEETAKAKAMLTEIFAGSKSEEGGISFVGKADGKGDDKDKGKMDFSKFLKQTKAQDKEMMAMLEKMAEAMPDDETVKKACATMKKRMGQYPAMEEDEEEVAMQSKGEGVQTLLEAVAEIVDKRLAPLAEQIAGLSTVPGQVDLLSERIKNLEAEDQAAEVIAALVKRLPETSLFGTPRPSDEAEDVGETADLIEELQKRLDFGDDAGARHPLGHFVGGGEA